MKRGEFILKLGGLTGSALAAPEEIARALGKLTQPRASLSAEAVAKDEDFWFEIQQAYTVSQNLINLNNGGVSPQPRVVQDAEAMYMRKSNEAPSYYMWRILDDGRPKLRADLARLAGCAPEELAIVRNTTEALDLVIKGIDLKAGDEVVLCRQDYPNMINAWKQRELREGIVLKWINLELPIEDDNTFVRAFADAFTDKTKVAHVTHMINWIGQVVPVAKIAAEARKRGIQVIADGAHTFAQLEFKIPDLDCDYFGTSLHKWLSAPFGTGLLYVRKDRIKDLWSLFPNDKIGTDDIIKFEGLGTRSIPAEMAIGHALAFHNGIGAARKSERLFYLKNYWTERAAKIPGVTIHTSFKRAYSGAIALVSVAGFSPNEVAQLLERDYRIHTVAIEWENISGVRVTPHVYTPPRDLDLLVAALEEIAAKAGQKKEK